jgi:integrase
MSARTQKGYIWREGNIWLLRYRDSIVKDGVLTRKQFTRNLGYVAAEHARLKRPPEVVIEQSKEFLAKLNSNHDPQKNVMLLEFVQNVWFPHVENGLAASTAHSYGYYWKHLLAPRCHKVLLRDFSTPDGQKLIYEIARQNPEMKKTTLHKLKSMLSAIFRLAIAQNYRPGPNPIRETSLPRAPESEDTLAYDLENILAMLRLAPEPSRTVLAIAGFAGLRRGELEGLSWESYDGETLKVIRAMWQGIAGEPKSKKSKASVPVIAPLRKLLDQHRARYGNPETGIMFQTRNGTPLSMNNLLNDQILPAIEKCAECGSTKRAHRMADHEYQRDSSLPEWHGFHAFRRGLATNLHDLGVDDLTIQRILRHSDVSVTQRCYIKTLPQQAIDAMAKVESAISQKTADLGDAFSLMCSERAVNEPTSKLVQ